MLVWDVWKWVQWPCKKAIYQSTFFGHSLYTFSSPLISTLICNRMAPETLDLSERFSKLYQTSISPDKVLTSIMVWPRKSSDSLVNFCLNLDFKSLSSSQTQTLMRSDELWHSLQKNKKQKKNKIKWDFEHQARVGYWSSI